jgi:hypothetical protein
MVPLVAYKSSLAMVCSAGGGWSGGGSSPRTGCVCPTVYSLVKPQDVSMRIVLPQQQSHDSDINTSGPWLLFL